MKPASLSIFFLLKLMAYLENLIREICAPQKGFSIYCKPTFSGNNLISLFIGDKLVAKTTFCDQALKKNSTTSA